jgi:rod shape-determining protein MreD
MVFSKVVKQILSIFLLLLIQVVVFNNMVVFNGYTPLFYISFVLFYDPKVNHTPFLFLSFLLGFGLDLANYTPGVNAFSCVFIAYFRRFILSAIDRNYFFEANYFSFSKINLFQVLVYIFAMSFIHHFILFLIEGMKFSLIFTSLYKAFFTSILSSLFIFIYFYLFED